MKSYKLDSFKMAYDKNFKFYDENILMLSWYSQKLIKTLQHKRFKSILSLGIGHKVVSKAVVTELGHSLEKYLIIEGSHTIINEYKNDIKLPDNVHLQEALFEEFDTEEKFDAIEIGFVLEHVDDPLFLIKRYTTFLNPNGLIFIAVPNARSLHRLVGNKAGMLDTLYRLSEHDLELGHKRYFDMESVLKLILQARLKIVNIEGIFLKPLSLSQLQSLKLSPDVIHALFSIGVEYPELSNAIYIEATS